jgi:hypothetical protein
MDPGVMPLLGCQCVLSSDPCSPSLAAEQVLRNGCGPEQVIPRGLELLAQIRQVDVEQLALPLAHLDVGAIHQRDNRPRHPVERRHIDERRQTWEGSTARLQR